MMKITQSTSKIQITKKQDHYFIEFIEYSGFEVEHEENKEVYIFDFKSENAIKKLTIKCDSINYFSKTVIKEYLSWGLFYSEGSTDEKIRSEPKTYVEIKLYTDEKIKDGEYDFISLETKHQPNIECTKDIKQCY